MNETLQSALALHRAGVPITLCAPGKKTPIDKGWPEKTYTAAEIKRQFRQHGDLNIGVVLGPRSNLVDIEYDASGGERALSELFGDDVPVTPTWRSTRSPHRLLQWHPGLAAVNKAMIRVGPLEVRIGANGKGCQSLLPPSTTDGTRREWLVPLSDCDPAPLNEAALQRILLAAGVKAAMNNHGGDRKSKSRLHDETLKDMAHSTHRAHRRSPVSTVSTVCHTADSSETQELVQQAIAATTPNETGVRHRCLFRFARHLKAIEALTAADASELEPYVAWWHEVALPSIGTKEWEETWFDFRNAWNAVKFPAGQEPIVTMFTQAVAKPLPLCAEKYQQQQLRALVALCRELQREAGDKPFFLAGRIAAEQIGMDHRTTARWLKMLCLDGVLSVVRTGTRHHASEYMYLGD